MPSATEKIVSEIAQLPLDELVSLHERLVTTIHDKSEKEGLDPEFRAEIQRRIDEVDSGKVISTDAFEALKNM